MQILCVLSSIAAADHGKLDVLLEKKMEYRIE
jgi:hypothetical protein